MKSWQIATVAVMASWGVGVAADETRLEDEVRGLERRVVANALVQRLGITDAQAKELLDIGRELAQAKSAFDERLTGVRADQVEAFTAFRAEDLANVGFTPLVEQVTHQTEEREKTLLEAFHRRAQAIEARSPLTEDQRRQIDVFKKKDDVPALFAREGKRADKGVAIPSEVDELRAELDEIHKEKYGSLGPICRLVLAPGVVEVLAQRIGAPAPEMPAAPT